MKTKNILLVSMLLASAIANAQIVRIYKNGAVVKEYAASNVQQVQFVNGQTDELVVAKSAAQVKGFPITSSPKIQMGNGVLTFTDNTNSTMFPIDEKVSLNVQNQNVTPSGNCLSVTCTEAKTNIWDSQIYINFPVLLEKGKTYTLTMNVKGSQSLNSKPGEWGPEAIQPVMQDNNSSNRDEWGNPADIKHLAHFAITTEWVNNVMDCDGNAIVTDGNFPYSRLLLNLGNYVGTLYIDNIRLIDSETGDELFCIAFETAEELALVEDSWMKLPHEVVDLSSKRIVTLDASGYATYCSDKSLDFAGVTGLKAYIITSLNPSTGMLSVCRVDNVPAGVGILLKGAAGENYEVPVVEDAGVVANLLNGNVAATTLKSTEGNYTNLMLSETGDGKMAFCRFAGSQSLSANNAWLRIPTNVLSKMNPDQPLALNFVENGDLNGDAEVSISDVVTLVNVILEK